MYVSVPMERCSIISRSNDQADERVRLERKGVMKGYVVANLRSKTFRFHSVICSCIIDQKEKLKTLVSDFFPNTDFSEMGGEGGAAPRNAY